MASVATPASSVLSAAEVEPIGERPYAPSWLDRVLDWLDALPGPTWLAYLVFGVLAFIWTSAIGWMSGDVPVGQLDPHQTSYFFYLVAPFALAHVLDRAAGPALRAFAPATDMTPAEVDRYAYELTTVPARPALVLLAAGAGLDLLSWITDPDAAMVTGRAPAGLVLRAAGEFLLAGAWAVVSYQVIRQLRLVARLHERAVRINLFRPGPLYAFSHLTVRAGIGLIVIAAYSVLTSPLELLLTLVSVVFTGGILVIGFAAFVLPLQGMQRKLATEKARLIDAAYERLELTIGRLHEAVDSGDLTRADELQKTMAALVQERDIVGRLRTWPWDPSTLRAFASAIALPIGLWLVTRALERVL